MSFDYDAFLSYNRKDAAAVEAIALRLRKEAQLRVFLDKWCLIPGDPWQDDIEKALDKSATCVIFVGPHGPSPWAHIEMRAALELRLGERMLRVIPTLLPGADEKSLPLFLKSFTWVDYTAGFGDERAYESLRAGVCGFELGPPEPSATVSDAARRNLGVAFADSLLPVPNFQNRPELNDLRSFWAADGRAGVLALVGIGGSGKTALVCRFLQELPGSGIEHPDVARNEELPQPEGIFVWSFYDNPNVEYFTHSIYEYLTGQEESEGPARYLMQRVTRFTEQSNFQRVLIVLDGLEVVQEGLDSPGGFGLLRDSSMRHLMRRLAQGGLGFRMIVTSRFPFPELTAFQGAGYRLVETDNLEPQSARSLLKSRGVKGTDAELNALVRDYGNHALTLDHLGTLLRDFFDGDSRRAAELPPLGTTVGDAYAEFQAYRLSRIFSFYERHLPPNELTVLKVLCVFRVPVPLDSIVRIFSGARDDQPESNVVPKMNEVTIRSLLAQLRSRRLISFYGNRERTTCSVHPAIRDHFYRSIGPDSTEIHAAVSTHLVALSERPERERYPMDSADLDILEEFIYHSVKGGDLRRAINFYHGAVGGYTNLAWRLSDYQRGLRITSLLTDALGIDARYNWSISCHPFEHSLYHLDLGRPALAESQLSALLETFGKATAESDSYRSYRWYMDWDFHESMVLQCICDTLLAQGKLPEAERVADSVFKDDVTEWLSEHLKLQTGSNPFGRRAVARYLSGNVSGALEDFQKAGENNDQPREWSHHREMRGEYHVAFHVMLLAHLGKLRAARALLNQHASYKVHDRRPMLTAQFALAGAEIYLLSGEHAKARERVDSALAWSIQSGHQEVYARASLLAARAAMRDGDLGAVRSMLSEAEQVARSCGFRVVLSDVLTVAGHFAVSNRQSAYAAGLATEALEISSDPSCGYKWGEGNASHLLAEIMLEGGDVATAAAHVGAALRIRKELEDPRGRNTQLLAERIGR